MFRTLAIAAALLALAKPAHATEAGLDVGHAVENGAVQDVFDQVDATGARWVRINMRLDAWNAPDDATPHGPDGLTWFQAYDRVIDTYLARGIQVYALINDESVSSDLDHSSPEWIALYVQNAVKIVDHFKNRVRVYEIINEPNDYAGGTSARFAPATFAEILQDTYLAVKHDAGHIDDRCWQVQLVSGPILSLDGNDGASYLDQTYDAGRNQLAWDYTHQVTGSYPLDGIGYHVYVAQGSDSTLDDVGANTTANLDALWSVIAAREGSDTGKQIWLSEYGWRADLVGDDGQAQRLAAGFDAMAQSGHVATAMYFNYQDFPGNEWGVYDASGQRRPSADTLAQIADANAPDRAARLVSVVAPPLAPGQTGTIDVTLVNRGGTTWSDGVRLGAAPGCPEAATDNAIAWTPADSDGYANGIEDARIYLAQDVPPGGSVTVHVPVTAPAQAGTYTFAARMVEDGVGWFGPTVTAQVVVAAAGAGGPDSGMGGGSGSGSGSGSGAGGGCAAGGDHVGLWGFAAALGIVCRRRRRRV